MQNEKDFWFNKQALQSQHTCVMRTRNFRSDVQLNTKHRVTAPCEMVAC
jgi:hypothetical protein